MRRIVYSEEFQLIFGQNQQIKICFLNWISATFTLNQFRQVLFICVTRSPSPKKVRKNESVGTFCLHWFHLTAKLEFEEVGSSPSGTQKTTICLANNNWETLYTPAGFYSTKLLSLSCQLWPWKAFRNQWSNVVERRGETNWKSAASAAKRNAFLKIWKLHTNTFGTLPTVLPPVS